MSAPYYQDEQVTVLAGDCLAVMAEMPAESVHAIVTDPPYGLEFMGKDWDAPWEERDVNADAGFHGGGVSATRNAPSFTGSTNPKCLTCKGTRRGRRDGTAKVAVCLCPDGGRFPNVRAVEMRAFQDWCEQWATECLRVLKPGGHLLAFGGSRTWHRLAAAVEDAGFEIRDSIAWLYGSGFPKSLDVSKAIDKAAGAEREVVGSKLGLPGYHLSGKGEAGPAYGSNLQKVTTEQRAAAATITAPATPDAERWQGWGTALKPAFEPIVVGRKPLAGTVAGNVLAHGTGALNIDATRVQYANDADRDQTRVPQPVQHNDAHAVYQMGTGEGRNGETFRPADAGRWPTNVVLDDTQAAELDKQSGETSYNPAGTFGTQKGNSADSGDVPYGSRKDGDGIFGYGDRGGASRFFPTFRYEAKAPTEERPRVNGIAHPTVKPLDLMRWLVRLVTPPGGTILDPFAGSGTTLEAALIEGFQCIGIEREADYLPLIKARITKPIEPVLDFGGIA